MVQPVEPGAAQEMGQSVGPVFQLGVVTVSPLPAMMNAGWFPLVFACSPILRK